MHSAVESLIPRRLFLTGSAATGLLVLSGCQTGPRYSLVEVVRRMLLLAADNALDKLTAPGGFWDSQVARIALPDLFGSRGGVLQGVLTSVLFRDRLHRELNHLAERGAERAAPVVAEVIRTISIQDAVALIRGGPTASTSYLRSQMGPGLINAMIPGLADAIRVSSDPIVGQAIATLTGVDVGGVAQALAIGADNSIWYQIGLEEAAIRANPESTNDPMLIAALKVL
ncbi:DUF4197 domain-containing protein [Novosphingobium sp.]|uniref:DUF4197 domain-containing protein n=1 Tax=Novosphingobium sp. TaxID=1874826 RepID=UPI002733AFA4|nr:DUF4197 domain-containing protein [Novosphingobium sp.]MDP3906882.1 DUF4197 domain-containing protein [Novosphingobium sp.]